MKEKKEIYIRCKDHFVSHKYFNLIYNAEYDMLQTTPTPAKNELANYYQSNDYISHTDAKITFTDKLYQIVKSYMLKRKEKIIAPFKNDKDILDIGCGTGDFLKTCEKKGWNIHGIETEPKALKKAKSKLKNTNTVYDDIEMFSNHKFDVITLWHVLEHIPDIKSYSNKLSSLLKKDGTLIIAVPNYKSFDATYYKSFWAAYDVPRHLWHFSKFSIYKIFKEQHFQIIKTKAMPFDAFYISLISEKYKTGKSNFIKAFIIGMLSNIISIIKKEPSSRIYVLKKCKN